MYISSIRWTYNFIFVVSMLLISWQYLTLFVGGELMRILNVNPWLSWLEKKENSEILNAGWIEQPETFLSTTHSNTVPIRNQDDMEIWRDCESFWFRRDWDLIVLSTTKERMNTKSFDYIIIFSKLPRNINSYFKTNLVISWLKIYICRL